MDLNKTHLPETEGDATIVPSGEDYSTERVRAEIEKKPVTSTLRGLCVGDVASFPWEQRTSVLIIANRLKRELARIGWDYSYSDDEDNFVVKITRNH